MDIARKCSPRDLDDAIAAYVAGEAAHKIADRIPGLSEERLMRELRLRGLARSRAQSMSIAWESRSDRRDVPIDEIVARYQAGESEKSIADSLDVSRGVIADRLTGAGVTRRGHDQNAISAARMGTDAKARQLAALDANRDRGIRNSMSDESRHKMALSRERLQSHVGPYETALQHWLTEHDYEAIAQKAIGRYNVDLAVGAIAVELFGGAWHAHGGHLARAPKRFGYLFDSGWAVMAVWITHRTFDVTACGEYLVAWLQESERDPSARSGYRVIRGSGEEIARGGPDGDEFARVVPFGRRKRPRS